MLSVVLGGVFTGSEVYHVEIIGRDEVEDLAEDK